MTCLDQHFLLRYGQFINNIKGDKYKVDTIWWIVLAALLITHFPAGYLASKLIMTLAEEESVTTSDGMFMFGLGVFLGWITVVFIVLAFVLAIFELLLLGLGETLSPKSKSEKIEFGTEFLPPKSKKYP